MTDRASRMGGAGRRGSARRSRRAETRVDRSGAVTKVAMDGTTDGAVCGRRPEGLRRAELAARSEVAAHFASAAHLEAASVVAFRVLERELVALGAPAEPCVRVRPATSRCRPAARSGARGADGTAARPGLIRARAQLFVDRSPRRVKLASSAIGAQSGKSSGRHRVRVANARIPVTRLPSRRSITTEWPR